MKMRKPQLYPLPRMTLSKHGAKGQFAEHTQMIAVMYSSKHSTLNKILFRGMYLYGETIKGKKWVNTQFSAVFSTKGISGVQGGGAQAGVWTERHW